MKIYISGQITGLPYEEAEKAFNESETRLKKFGFEVVNPLKKEIPNTASWTEHMRMDIKLLMDCDTIYMLRNFRQSNGAMIEYELAKKLGYTVIRQMSPSTDTVDDIRDTEPFSTGIELKKTKKTILKWQQLMKLISENQLQYGEHDGQHEKKILNLLV